MLLTDTPVAQTEPTLYACRRIEQGFRGLKPSAGSGTRRAAWTPIRVGRHWLVLAIATLLAVAYGTRREEAEARHLPPGRLPPRRVDRPTRPRCPRVATATGRGAAAPLAAARVVCVRVADGLRPVPTSARAMRRLDPGGT